MKSKSNQFLRCSLVLAASSAFLSMGSTLAATYDWTGATNSNFTEAGNWTQNAWTQWDDYSFGGTPTNTSITINGEFGMNSLTLQSGLTPDIVIDATSNPVIMGVGVAGNSSALVSIAAASKDLTINGNYIANGTVTWDIGSGRTLTMNGSLNEWFQPASLVKNGAGTAVLAGNFGFTGGAAINGGTLELNVDSGSRDLGSTTFSGTGTLRKTGAGGVIWGAGSATFALGAGSLIDVQEGVFGGGANANEVWTNNLAGLNVASGAIFNGVEANVRVDALTGAGTITSGYGGAGYENFTFGVNNGSGTFSGSLTDSDTAAANFVKAGSGTQTLTGPLDYNGTTTVSGGTLELPDGDWKTGGLYSNGTGASGTIIVGAGATLSTSSGVTGLQNGLVLNGGSVSSRGLAYSNYRNLLLESNITAGGAATSTISSEISLRGSYSIIVGTDSTLNITGGIADDGFGNGSQGITKEGEGTLTLAATNNSYTGATVVNDGTLVVNGNISTSSMTTAQSGAAVSGSGTVGSLTINSGAFLNPGNSPGSLNVDGDYNQAGTLTIEITGLIAGTQHDQVNVDLTTGDMDGSVTLSGSLVTAFSGGSYANGNLLFILLNDASDAINGTFAGLAQNDIVTNYGGFDWRISYSADSDTNSFTGGNDIALIAVPEPRAALLGGVGLVMLLRRRRA